MGLQGQGPGVGEQVQGEEMGCKAVIWIRRHAFLSLCHSDGPCLRNWPA